jgi:hypothetical protein
MQNGEPWQNPESSPSVPLIKQIFMVDTLLLTMGFAPPIGSTEPTARLLG